MSNSLKTSNVDEIHNGLLDGISDTYQKTEGFPTWDLLRAVALGFKKLWDRLFLVEYKQDIDNLEGVELDQIIYQRTGLRRKEAVSATGYINIVNGSGYIVEGDLFETESLIRFESTESKQVKDGDTVAVKAVIAGEAGNVATDLINQMPVTIAGVSKITNLEPTIGGYDAETDEDYRQRYYEYLQTPATAGNKYHYMMWAKEVDGVKAVKVEPCWNGINTVKVYVVGNDYRPAEPTLIADVQEHIDPNSEGKGLGTAPIGAMCTIVPAEELSLNISVNIMLLSTADPDAVKENIKTALNDYVHTLAYKAEYISYAKLGASILSVDGVIDYADLLVNNKQANIEIGEWECPVITEVTINV